MTSERHEPTPAQYWKIAGLLSALTAVEVAIYYIHLDLDLGNYNTILLISLAALKFVIVVGWFMHLRYEKPMLTRFFTAGFILAVSLYTIILTALGLLLFQGN